MPLSLTEGYQFVIAYGNVNSTLLFGRGLALMN